MKNNAFIRRSDNARTYLMKWTGMDELDYHLTILEGGCWYLEQLTKPQTLISEEVMREYRDHLTAVGYWRFYEWAFRTLEIALMQDWSREGAIELMQSKEWLRARLLEVVRGLPWNQGTSNQLDTWLKYMEPFCKHIKAIEPTLIPQ